MQFGLSGCVGRFGNPPVTGGNLPQGSEQKRSDFGVSRLFPLNSTATGLQGIQEICDSPGHGSSELIQPGLSQINSTQKCTFGSAYSFQLCQR